MRRLIDRVTNRMETASVDAAGKGPARQFLSSARFGLWPAIFLSSFAFSRLLDYELRSTVAVATILCLTASIGFLFNDTLDSAIDRANGIFRWSLQTTQDWGLFLSAIGIYVSAVILGSLVLSRVSIQCLLASLLIVFAYSIFCKKVPLLGNIIAAALSMSPGLIMLVDVNARVDHSFIWHSPAVMFIATGFCLLLSREIRFDEFDRVGDAVGGRLTLPMIIDQARLDILHLVLSSASLLILFCTLSFESRFSQTGNLVLGCLATASTGFLLYGAYRSQSKTIFYKLTRFAMLLVPGTMLVGFA